jgi:uncharacterized protein
MQDHHHHHERENRFSRIRRTKRLLRRLPRRANIHRYPVLKWFAAAARKRHYLWSFRLPQMTPAFYAGAILAFMPLYGAQLAISVALAVVLRANLPVLAGLQLITNPLTLAPIYFITYRIGREILNWIGVGGGTAWVFSTANALALGGLIAGILLGLALDLLYRFLIYEANQRNLLRRPKSDNDPTPTP